VSPPGLGRTLLFEYLLTLAAVELLLMVYVPGALAGFGFLALALCARRNLVDERSAALLPVLVAVLVTRLVTEAALPGGDPPPARLAVAALALCVCVAAAARACPRDWLRLSGGAGGWRVQAAVMLAGIPLGLLVILLARNTVPVREGVPLALAVGIIALVGLATEVLFRGLLIPALTGVVGRCWDLLAGAVLYAITFISYGSVSVLVALAAAFLLGWCRRRTDSVAGVIGAHAVVMPLTVLVWQLTVGA
jgi:membrane protease YdiL (CAAX protease family)